LWACTCLALATLLVGSAQGAGVPDEPERRVLARFAWNQESDLRWVEAEGGRVRFYGGGTAIIELPERELERLRDLLGGLEVVDTLAAGRRHWVVFPDGRIPVDSLSAYGKVTPLDVLGVLLMGVEEGMEERLRRLVFSMSLLPEGLRLERLLPGRVPSVPGPSAVGGLELSRSGLGTARVAAEQVSIDSIMSAVHFVSFDDSAGVLRNRFCLRDDAVWMAHLLREKLRSATGGIGTDSLEAFPLRYGGTIYTLFNVVARIPGKVPGSGTFVICGHYDSYASRTAGWDPYGDPAENPAPGADDNGSGIASVLECARVLSQLEFDFDVEFVLFCAEELFLSGSRAYVASREALGSNIIGVLNFDMIAFRSQEDSTFVRTNLYSAWLSNHIERMSDALYDSIGLRVGLTTVDGFWDASDHSSFWTHGFDAVHFFEHSTLPPLYPDYHTVNDTEEKLNYELCRKVASLGAASVAYFAETEDPWDLEVLAGDIEFRVESPGLPASSATVGQIVTISPSFHNVGGAAVEILSVHVRIYDGDPAGGGALIGERLVEGPIPGGGSPVLEPFGWLLEEKDVGAHRIFLAVDAGEDELDVSNNVAWQELTVGSDRLDVRYSFVFPSPVRGVGTQATLRFFLTDYAGGVEVEVYDVSGSRVGGCKDDSCGDVLLEPGDRNDISLQTMGVNSELASGVYTYRLRVSGDGVVKASYGRFAIVR
jgi:hypothetical protein